MHALGRWAQGILVVMALLASPMIAVAQPQTAAFPMPPGGGLQAGPLGLNVSSPSAGTGQFPAAIQIDAASVDAEVEQNKIVDGAMLNPSGPWVVSWYEGTARLGERSNSVMAGHLDYWGVGPAVFANLANLHEGDEIRLTGTTGDVFTYQVEWTRLYQLAELNSGALKEIVGATPVSTLTLITCGGAFDSATGQYLSRFVVRAKLSSVEHPTAREEGEFRSMVSS